MKDFVTFEIARKLKEKGFPQTYMGKYDMLGPTYIEDGRLFENGCIVEVATACTAPTIWDVLKWLREEKKIFIAINIGYCYESYEKPFPTNPKMEPILKGYYYGVWDLGNLNDKNALSEYFESYELAAIAGIEYVLDNLI